MKLTIPKEALDIITRVRDAGFEIYIVGGAVRDLNIGRPIYDWDFATNAEPEKIVELFADSFYDNKYGTVGIPSKDEKARPYEITTYRTEHGYSDSRRPDKVSWGKDIFDDLKRRDFTINAIAIKVTTGSSDSVESDCVSIEAETIDPFDGLADINNRVIKAVGDPQERFKEDALRMMRAVRIASEINFSIENDTKQAIQNAASTIHNIASERIRDELLKLIASPHAYNGMLQFKEVGLLKETLPELDQAFEFEQKSPNRHHIYDVGTHLLMSLKYCRSLDPIVRLATLLHDIGKPKTYRKLPTGVITFYNHEVVGAKIAKNIAERLKLSNKDTKKLVTLVRYHQFTVDEKQTDSAIRRFIKKVGIDLVPDMLDLRIADRLGGGARETSWRLEEFKQRLLEVQKQPFTVHDLKITGFDVMKELSIGPGPQVGKLLDELFKKVEKGIIPNQKEVLIETLKQLYE